VTDCPGLIVKGKLPPTTEKPGPDAEAELMVKVEVEVEVSVTGRTTGVFSATLPNFKLDALAESGPFPLPLREAVAIG